MILDELSRPIVLAPLAGGPSTAELAAAVGNAGGFGFLAGGYLTPAELASRLARTRELTTAPIGVNLFVPGQPSPPHAVTDYADRLAGEAERLGIPLGRPRFDDDGWADKLDLLRADPVPVVSFTFGCPDHGVVERLHHAGSEVWVTVTTVGEATTAAAVGVDVLVAQGAEAGGHRGSFHDDPAADVEGGIGLLSLLQLLLAHVDLPLVAAGGIATGRGIAAVLAAGACAAALGTAFLRCPEAGTSPVHRQALGGSGGTALTRAFTGRLARGICNRFLDEHGGAAPAAYPEIHYLTAPLRDAARRDGDPDLVNLWAGQTHQLGRDLPAADLVHLLAAETTAAVATAPTTVPRSS